MKRILMAVLLFGVPFSAAARDKTQGGRPPGFGYVFAAAGMCQHGVALAGAGGGGEVFVNSRLSLGGDIGGYGFTDTPSFAVAGLNASFHFTDATRRRGADPFVTGGWAPTAAPAGFYGRGVNVGGGLNYWVRDRVGIRWETRGYVVGEEFVLSCRLGLSLR